MSGPTKPPRLPTELIKPIDVAVRAGHYNFYPRGTFHQVSTYCQLTLTKVANRLPNQVPEGETWRSFGGADGSLPAVGTSLVFGPLSFASYAPSE
jgi:hypothetical protein